jgi:hypothetical protein
MRKGVPGALRDRPARGGSTAHEQRDADKALITDHGNFGRRTIFQHVQERYDGVGRKINVAQYVAGFELPEESGDKNHIDRAIALRTHALTRSVVTSCVNTNPQIRTP